MRPFFQGVSFLLSTQQCLLVLPWFCCPRGDGAPQNSHSSPCLTWGTQNLQKKGTKMKLLKQHQPPATELHTLCLSKHPQHGSQGHRGVKSPELWAGQAQTLISDKPAQLNWMEQSRLDLEASGKAIGTQAQQHSIHLSPVRWWLCVGHSAFRFNNATAPQQH